MASLSASQHGVFSRAQALEAGVAVSLLERRISQGRLRVLHRGVYSLAGLPPSFHHDLLAACLAAGSRAVASHRSALALWGLGTADVRPEISVPLPCSPRLSGVGVHRVRGLDRVDVGEHEGVPTTRPARTLLDAAGVLPPARLELAVDQALARGLVSCRQLRERLDDLGRRGRRGAGALELILQARPEGRFRVQSTFEQRLLRVLRTAGFVGMVSQYEVKLPGGGKARIDVAFPAARLALEADSYAHHASRSDWSRDHTRNRRLAAVGWRVLPVTWDDLRARPGEVCRLVASALASEPGGPAAGGRT